MPPRRRSTANESLTPENLETLANALAAGKRATVYLIEATPSLGLPEGTSARVVSIAGNTVTISPKGVNDELPFEADELRMTRNPPGGAPKPAAPAAPKPEIAEWIEPATEPKPKPAAKPAAPKPATPKPAEVSKPAASPKPAAQSARKGKKGPDSVSVTIHAGADNDWSVTVTHGARRPGKAQPVSPESVSRAVRELGDDSAVQAVEAVISHAREEAAQRVAELSRQLEEAQSMLAALESGTQ
ncbi:translation initiation factor [Rhodococcus sp. BP-252]|uniref:Translation initiation factor n=1 Tax=Rhodococcoides kyotonense TaxID=398843 RepID=A0A177YD91_9NOCA|nr:MULTISPECIES: DUF6319 family protein [Rhodococcus]MBY6413037.1 translation initiation factor [Rhodococcus sp. BP-320]MBY6418524.1 translation initiation factor [Rhodococcus sp. BP-321]MBY6422774.1 translation initiation factor [Rhodococcus sp. BP-324]MBY6428510.1 translation initiation factor [Rhodococcus sp. BP-323]MBY6432959.1 translation initiation factor [Rhodococcus sp. BP-322]